MSHPFSSSQNTHSLLTSIFLSNLNNMQNPNPNPNPNPPRSSSSSPQRPPVTDETQQETDNHPVVTLSSSGNEEGSGFKTPEQVLAELTATPTPSPPEGTDGSGGGGGGGSQGVLSAPIAVGVGVGIGSGGSMVVVEDRAVSEGRGKKRKAADLKDPPSGEPTCPVCQKTFTSWKGAFGHMRKHPERSYRGFYRPPTFSSPTSTTNEPVGDPQGATGEKNSGEGMSSSQINRGLVFDLNQPIEEADAAERSEAPAGSAAEEQNAEEGKKSGFDLNELPSADDDE